MTARILDGKRVAAAIREEIAAEVAELRKSGTVPGLAAVLVGDDPGSRVYVGAKKKDAEAIGIASSVHELPPTTGQQELEDLIRGLNADPSVHGIIVQLPLPPPLDPIAAQETLDPAKDVDGLHPENAGLLALGRARLVPCTPLGIKVLLEREGIDIDGARVVVVGRSNLVGRPVSILLSAKGAGANATVTLCHTGTRDLAAFTRSADLLIAAAGTPKAITAEMVGPGAVVIDVGISRTEEGLVGDVDFDGVAEVAGAITPVPGGVGPMTRAMLLANTVRVAASHLG
ncbi:MAG: bifunctional 5,10-methylenetetrahydrofolate dehydrogenase/5,10-methenyltetrahydrofolate cyclohydrolase [Actinomycetota bacterium]